MKSRKVFLFLVFGLFIIGTAYSQVADKQYAETYGTGIVIASGNGLPLKNKFDKSQIDYKNGIFYVKGGEGATISIRALLKDGKTFKYYLDSLKKNYSPDSIVEYSERIEFNVWVSHDDRGKLQGDKWPVKPGVEPDNIFNRGHIDYNMSELMNENNQGLKWENIISQDFDGVTLASWLPNAKPGCKIFMSFRVTLVINTEWDPFANKWKTMLCRTEPIAAGTIEIK